MSALPYSKSTASPRAAQERIRKTLIKFGVDRISFDEDFKNKTLSIHFQYRDFPVTIPIDINALAETYLDADPYTYRKRGTRTEWEERIKETAERAAFSLLDDFVKGMVLMAEMGVFSFEEIFISYFVGKNGKRLGEEFKECLPQWVAGQKALTEGDERYRR